MMRFIFLNLMDRLRVYMLPVGTARRLQAENARFKDMCASAYQLAALVGAPARFLDTLSKPLDATPQQISTLLPIEDHEINAVRESKALRDLLKEARDALYFFKSWGDSLNSVLGYSPPREPWRPALEAIARIDAALRLPSIHGADLCGQGASSSIRDDGRFLAFWVMIWVPFVCTIFLLASTCVGKFGEVVITGVYFVFVYAIFAPALYRLFIQGPSKRGEGG